MMPDAGQTPATSAEKPAGADRYRVIAEIALELAPCSNETDLLERAGHLLRERLEGAGLSVAVDIEGTVSLQGGDIDENVGPNAEELGMFTALVSRFIERIRGSNATEALEEHIRTAVANAPIMLYQVDKGETITLVLGPESSTASGLNFRAGLQLSESSASEHTLARIRKALHGEDNVETLEYGGRWFEIRRLPLRDSGGEVTGMIGVALDVTERHLAEERLRDNTRLQKAILDGANYAIFSCRLDGTFQTFNRAAESMFGYPASHVLGKATPLLFLRPDDLKEHWRSLSDQLGKPVAPSFEAFATRARELHADEFEVEALRRDGSHFPLRLSITSLKAEDGEVSGYVGIGYDLSEVRRVERMKNEFVSVVSHELRTPLTSIRGALGLLVGGVAGELPEKAREMLDIAQKNSERLVLLINDILDVEKIESGQMRFDREEVRVQDLVSAALEANRPYAEHLGANLKTSVSESCEDVAVEGDEARLMQVLSNLISNAAKYSPQGGEIRLEVSRQRVGEQEMVRFEVHDAGPGVPPDFVPRLFAKFAQADASSTRQRGGTGLGLAIAKAIVEKHGGEIGYVPPGRGRHKEGSTFYVQLPLLSRREQVIVEPDPRPTVLVCEDDIGSARQLCELLDKQGFATEVAATASKMRNCLRTKQYAGMTLDLMLPDADGLDLLRELREDERTNGLPIIIVSVKSHPDGLDGAAMEIVDWLQKPMDPIRLLTAVDNFAPDRNVKPRLLHVEDDPDIRQVTRAILGTTVDLTVAGTLREAHNVLGRQTFDLVLLDVGLPDGNGMDLVPLLNQCDPPVPVILFSARETDATESFRVAAALVKSKTSNRQLVETIQKFQQFPRRTQQAVAAKANAGEAEFQEGG